MRYPLYRLELIVDEVQLGEQVTGLGAKREQENSVAIAGG